MPLPKVFKVLKLQSQSGESPASPAEPSAFVGVTLVKNESFEWADRRTHSVPTPTARQRTSTRKPTPPGGKNIFQHFLIFCSFEVPPQSFCSEISGAVSEVARVWQLTGERRRLVQIPLKRKNERPIQNTRTPPLRPHTPAPHGRRSQPITAPTRSLCDTRQWWTWPCPPC